ncbi:hypothetical protein C8R47DRAFT_95742 [Mycena vitilis]|nr:hypothetical protein C8R47DRAFT_95742 [Mycena vitilis]
MKEGTLTRRHWEMNRLRMVNVEFPRHLVTGGFCRLPFSSERRACPFLPCSWRRPMPAIVPWISLTSCSRPHAAAMSITKSAAKSAAKNSESRLLPVAACGRRSQGLKLVVGDGYAIRVEDSRAPREVLYRRVSSNKGERIGAKHGFGAFETPRKTLE